MVRIGMGIAVVIAALAALCGSSPAAVDCSGTLQAWRIDPGMRQYLNAYSCDCSNGNSRMPVCTKRGGGGSHAPSYGGGSKSSQPNLNRQIAQTLVAGFMQAMITSLFQSPAPAQVQNQKPARDLEEEKRQAEFQKQVREQIAVMEKDYKRMQQEAFGKNKQKLLSDLKVPGSGPSSGSMQQLYAANCSSYWELQAANAMMAGRDDEAEACRRNSAQARSGDLSNCGEAMAGLPDVPSPEMTDDFRDELYANLDEQIANRTAKIPEVKEKREQAEAGVRAKEKQVETLRVSIASLPTQEQRKASDDLLQKALEELETSQQLLDEAQGEYARLEKEIATLGKVHGAMTGKGKSKP